MHRVMSHAPVADLFGSVCSNSPLRPGRRKVMLHIRGLILRWRGDEFAGAHIKLAVTNAHEQLALQVRRKPKNLTTGQAVSSRVRGEHAITIERQSAIAGSRPQRSIFVFVK